MECWELGGESFFFHEVLAHANKEWVNAMFIPVVVFFTLACLVTTISLAIKMHLIAKKLKDRTSVKQGSNGSTAAELSEHASVAKLKERFDYNRMAARRNYCYLLTALLQDVPMGSCASVWRNRSHITVSQGVVHRYARHDLHRALFQ